jgi:hypothetical protein
MVIRSSAVNFDSSSAFAPIDAAVLKFILLIVLCSGETNDATTRSREIGNSVLSLNGPPEKFSADLFWPN